MSNPVLAGVIAGAVGTAVLHTVTYLDMAVRGRPASEVPPRAAAALARRLGTRVPGIGRTRQHRLTGLGELTGIAIGTTVGAVMGLARAAGLRPKALGPALAGGAAMALADLPTARLGVTDPRHWSYQDWLTGVVPHLAYGAATCAVLAALDGWGEDTV